MKIKRKKSQTKKFNPISLELVIENKNEYNMLIDLLVLNVSVPNLLGSRETKKHIFIKEFMDTLRDEIENNA